MFLNSLWRSYLWRILQFLTHVIPQGVFPLSFSRASALSHSSTITDRMKPLSPSPPENPLPYDLVYLLLHLSHHCHEQFHWDLKRYFLLLVDVRLVEFFHFIFLMRNWLFFQVGCGDQDQQIFQRSMISVNEKSLVCRNVNRVDGNSCLRVDVSSFPLKSLLQ